MRFQKLQTPQQIQVKGKCIHIYKSNEGKCHTYGIFHIEDCIDIHTIQNAQQTIENVTKNSKYMMHYTASSLLFYDPQPCIRIKFPYHYKKPMYDIRTQAGLPLLEFSLLNHKTELLKLNIHIHGLWVNDTENSYGIVLNCHSIRFI